MSQYHSELFAKLVYDLSKVGNRGVEWFRTAILLLSQKRRAAVLSTILLSFGALYGLSKTLDQRVTGGRRADRSWQWDREIILVTGGSRGMGELMVRGFALRNIRVAIIDQIPPQGPLPVGVKFYQADITSPQAVHEAAEQIRNDLGEPTVIINNAGIGTGQNILTTSDELIQRTFDVNTVSHFWLIREFLPAMIKRNHGHIVTIASMASFFVIAGNVDYSCSKVSALAFHEGLTQELKHRYNAPNVRTTVVHPSWVRTPMIEKLIAHPSFTAPFMEPEVVADAVVAQVLGGRSGQLVLPKQHIPYIWLRALPIWLQEHLRGRGAGLLQSSSF